jgi:transposase
MGTQKQRRKFTRKFKVKVALDAIKERETLSELANRYSLHPNQIRQWKREFLDNAENAFIGKKEKDQDDRVKPDKLYQKISELEAERDFLEKNLGKTEHQMSEKRC